MTRARTAVLASVSLVIFGMVAAMAARSATDTRPTLLPPEAAILPADSGFVAGLDVTRLFACPWYQKQAKNPAFVPPAEVTDLAKRAGVDLQKDFRQVLVAGDAREKGSAVVLVLGTFERKRVEGALGAAKDLTGRDYKGRKLWIPPAKPAPAVAGSPAPKPVESAFTVLSDGVLLAGPTESVTAALDRHAAKAPGLLDNAKMLALVQRVRPGSAFWMCGDETVLSAAASVAPAAGGFNVPSLRSLVASGDLMPDLSLLIVAEAADAAAAKTLAGMLQAVTGLLAMQGDKPEMADVKELLAGLDVTHEGPEVRLSARASYEVLDRIAAKAQTPPSPEPRSTPTTAPRAVPKKK